MLAQTSAHNLKRSLALMGRSHEGSHILDVISPQFTAIDPSLFSRPKHNPNGFYWRPDRPFHWTKSAALVCDQFRHENNRSLDLEVTFGKNHTRDRGAIHCKVQASNLSEPVEMTLPVTIESLTLSPAAVARDLVKACYNPSYR